MIKKFNYIVDKFNLGELKHIEKFHSSQNKVYKITTDNGIYVLKEFSKDAMGNYYYLKKRKEQFKY